MLDKRQFYIDGAWVDPEQKSDFEVINPATEEPVAVISLGSQADVDKAVVAANRAFETYGRSGIDERIALLERLLEVYRTRAEEMADTISLEMGAPKTFARDVQAPCGDGHIEATLDVLKTYAFQHKTPRGGSEIFEEPVGVCGLITPWNWPINQVVVKVLPALATGCTCVLKPSEIAPLSAMLFAEMLDEAGCPPGVFNLVNGDGLGVGTALSSHPDINMISFTGSTRAGILVSKAAADTVKRVTLELGGKSPNLLFADADLESAVEISVNGCFGNTGQSCDAPSRLLVERSVYDQVVALAGKVAQQVKVGDPTEEGNHLGPVISQIQYDKIQGLIQKGIDEGARLVSGGTGSPDGFEKGYFVKPTIFADVNSDMTIAREEIFGPVLSIIPFDSEEEAIAIANDTPYGLAAYIQTGDPERAKRVARRLRAGTISVNGEGQGFDAPFGGFKQSGNGRESGQYGLHDYLEIKSLTM